MVFGQNFCKKWQTWISEPHFGKVRGDARPWLMARWKAHGWLSICIKWTSFAIYYASGAIRRNVYSSVVFIGDRPLCTSILPGWGGPPSTILGNRKLETLGYPTVKTASFCITSFLHNTGVWQTDGEMDWQICRSIYSACKASFEVHCKKRQMNGNGPIFQLSVKSSLCKFIPIQANSYL